MKLKRVNTTPRGKVEEEYKMEYVPIWLREEREVGIKIGEEKGKQEGMEEKALETAKNLLELGIEIDKIAKATGVKKEEVEKLAAMASG